MPICDDKNEQPSAIIKTEIDHHASEAAKIKRARDQAYFNSYDFDAIEVLQSDDDVSGSKKIDLNQSSELPTNSSNSNQTSLDDAKTKLGYLKRFTSIFVPGNKNSHDLAHDIENQINDVEENFVGKNDEQSNTSSNRSSINSTSNLYEISNKDENIKNNNSNNKSNNNNNSNSSNNSGFVLPRAMLKYQSIGSSMPSSSSSAISTNSNSSASKLQIHETASLQDDGNIVSNASVLDEVITENVLTTSSIPTTSFIDASIEKSAKLLLLEKNKNSGLFHMENKKDALDHHPGLKSKNSNVTNLLATGSNNRILYDKTNPNSVSILIARDCNPLASNYSTDKSGGGSSGYYSSNLCSASSVEEHIYSEPVIDIIEHDNGGIKRQYKLNQGIQNYNNKKPVSSASHHYQNIKDHDDRNQKMNESLRILETSIENLDRHLKAFPKFDNIQASFIQTFPDSSLQNYERIKIENNEFAPHGKHLPTIMEGVDSQSQKKTSSWGNKSDEIIDDSLMDIDLDSFVLSNEKKKNLIQNEYPLSHYQSAGGIDNPSFVDNEIILNEEIVESNYKCAKYINSCPENAYQVESDIDTESSEKLSNAFFLKKYEDQIHFQNTREMLEDIQDKIRKIAASINENDNDCVIPKELEKNITVLKFGLEQYLKLMNRNSEMEIKQFFNSLVNNQKMVTITNAFERRKSMNDAQYEPLRNLSRAGGAVDDSYQPIFIHSSDPNFKLKRKSLSEILTSDDLLRLQESQPNFRRSFEQLEIHDSGLDRNKSNSFLNITQLQRNLSFHRPILEKQDIHDEKDLVKEWHRNKPSIWEMYYGSNRLNQTLITRSGPVSKSGKPMSYPSSRPESDFTLDLPRAEQLRLKMNQEKKFRQRCRIITTFLSLVFFLLTVMIVSLVLTRGKRMFGSML